MCNFRLSIFVKAHFLLTECPVVAIEMDCDYLTRSYNVLPLSANTSYLKLCSFAESTDDQNEQHVGTCIGRYKPLILNCLIVYGIVVACHF